MYTDVKLFVGCGVGVQYVINSALLQTYFEKKRPLATGLTTVGMSICNTVLPPATRFLTDVYTWRGAVIIIAGLFLQSIWLSLLLRPRTSTHDSGGGGGGNDDKICDKTEGNRTSCCSAVAKKLNLRLMLNARFLVFGFATTLYFVGYNMFYLHMVNKGLDSGLSKYQASLIPAASGIANLIWRPTFGFLSTSCQFKNGPIVGVATVSIGFFMAIFGAMNSFHMFMIFSGLAGLAAGKCKFNFIRINSKTCCLPTIIVNDLLRMMTSATL